MMNEVEFRSLYLCEFEPDPRAVELEERLELYYRQTPDEMHNRVAIGVRKEFNQWCKDRGYTADEVKRAKRRVQSNRDLGEQ